MSAGHRDDKPAGGDHPAHETAWPGFAAKSRDRRLLEIAEDGIISDEERSLYAEILDELTGSSQRFMSQILHRGWEPMMQVA